MNVFNILYQSPDVNHLLLADGAMLERRGHFVGSVSHTPLDRRTNDSRPGTIYQHPPLHLCHLPVMDHNGSAAHASETHTEESHFFDKAGGNKWAL